MGLKPFWLKKNWGKVLVFSLFGFVILFLLYGGIDGLIAKHQYKKSIKERDETISELWGEIGDSKKRETKWKASSEVNWTLAMDKEAQLRRKDQEMRIKIHEKRELQKKIKTMPVTQIIVRTIEIIQCDDVMQQEQGIVFSLVCGRENLTILEDSFSLKREVDDWKGQYSTCLGEVSDLKNVIVGKDGIIAERGVQLDEKDGIITEWKGKFNLSEKRGKRNWWKGLKTGGTIGGIAGFILGFVLGK